LMLIPNKHLETPHHVIERLRHDDPRLENTKASFELLEQPSSVDLGPSRADKEIKAKPEALVKGVTPDQPAPPASVKPRTPVAAAKEATEQSSSGLWGQIVRVFSGVFGGSASSKQAPAEDKPERQPAGARRSNTNSRNRRSGKPDNRRQDRNDATTQDQSTAPAANGRPAQQDGTPESEGGQSNRSRRSRRGRGRNRQTEGETMAAAELNEMTLQEQAEAAQATPQTAASGDSTAAGAPNETDETGADKPRRRSRRRRGKRTGETAQLDNGQDTSDSLESDPALASAQDSVATSQPTSAAEQTATPVAPAEPVKLAQVEAPSTESGEAVESSAIQNSALNEPQPTQTLVAEHATPQAPANGHDQASTPMTSMPSGTDDIVVRAQAVVADRSALNAIVASAGLQWVESDPQRVESVKREVAAQTPARLGREPKVMTAPPAVQLTQVETRTS